MEEYFQFLVDNWKELALILLSIVNILICIFRKKVKVIDSIREFILNILPVYISIAEDQFSNGIDKKSFVISSISRLLESKFQVSIDPYLDFVSDSIENILSTPKKKEVIK